MTAAQKTAKEKFKKAIAYRKKTGCTLKQAFAHIYGKKVGAVKKSAKSYHKDTKSHNVNIRVMSGLKINRKKGKLGALPVNFTGSILNLPFKVFNQYNLDGSVTLQIVENRPGGYLIAELNGRSGEAETAANKIWGKIDGSYIQDLGEKETKKVKKTILDFTKNLHTELKNFNSGKDTRTRKGAKLTIKSTPKKVFSAKDKIKDVLRSEKKRLKYGYTIVPGKVMDGIGKIDKDVIKKLDLVQKEIDHTETAIFNFKHWKNELIKKNGLSFYNNAMKNAKGYLSELKKHKSELKRFI